MSSLKYNNVEINFGTGLDGDLVVNSTNSPYTVSSDKNYANVTIQAGGVLIIKRPITATFTATVFPNSTTMNVSSASGIVVGNEVVGGPLIYGTTISSISGTTCTLSKNQLSTIPSGGISVTNVVTYGPMPLVKISGTLQIEPQSGNTAAGIIRGDYQNDIYLPFANSSNGIPFVRNGAAYDGYNGIYFKNGTAQQWPGAWYGQNGGFNNPDNPIFSHQEEFLGGDNGYRNQDRYGGDYGRHSAGGGGGSGITYGNSGQNSDNNYGSQPGGQGGIGGILNISGTVQNSTLTLSNYSSLSIGWILSKVSGSAVLPSGVTVSNISGLTITLSSPATTNGDIIFDAIPPNGRPKSLSLTNYYDNISVLYDGHRGGNAGDTSNTFGRGGASLRIIAKSIINNGLINVSGENGSSYNNGQSQGGGGGGGAGTIIIFCEIEQGSGEYRAVGGVGGSGGPVGFGGNGGGGTIQRYFGLSRFTGFITTTSLNSYTGNTYGYSSINSLVYVPDVPVVLIEGTSTSYSSNVSSISCSHTINSSYTNRLLLVSVKHTATLGQAVSANWGNTRMMYGHSTWSRGHRIDIFYLVNPDSGTQSASVTFNSNVNVNIAVTSFYGVDQNYPFRSIQSQTGMMGDYITSALPNVTSYTDSSSDFLYNIAGYSYGTGLKVNIDSVSSGAVATVSIYADQSGYGYAVGDIVSLTIGTPSPRVRIDSVNNFGAATSISVSSGGGGATVSRAVSTLRYTETTTLVPSISGGSQIQLWGSASSDSFAGCSKTPTSAIQKNAWTMSQSRNWSSCTISLVAAGWSGNISVADNTIFSAAMRTSLTGSLSTGNAYNPNDPQVSPTDGSLSVSSLSEGYIWPGSSLYGTGIPVNCKVISGPSSSTGVLTGTATSYYTNWAEVPYSNTGTISIWQAPTFFVAPQNSFHGGTFTRILGQSITLPQNKTVYIFGIVHFSPVLLFDVNGCTINGKGGGLHGGYKNFNSTNTGSYDWFGSGNNTDTLLEPQWNKPGGSQVDRYASNSPFTYRDWKYISLSNYSNKYNSSLDWGYSAAANYHSMQGYLPDFLWDGGMGGSGGGHGGRGGTAPTIVGWASGTVIGSSTKYAGGAKSGRFPLFYKPFNITIENTARAAVTHTSYNSNNTGYDVLIFRENNSFTPGSNFKADILLVGGGGGGGALNGGGGGGGNVYTGSNISFDAGYPYTVKIGWGGLPGGTLHNWFGPEGGYSGEPTKFYGGKPFYYPWAPSIPINPVSFYFAGGGGGGGYYYNAYNNADNGTNATQHQGGNSGYRGAGSKNFAGYSGGSGDSTKNSKTGAAFNITSVDANGTITGATLNTWGSGYAVNDILFFGQNNNVGFYNFIGSISGNVLTVTDTYGINGLSVGQFIYSMGNHPFGIHGASYYGYSGANGVRISALGTGSGSTGTYYVQVNGGTANLSIGETEMRAYLPRSGAYIGTYAANAYITVNSVNASGGIVLWTLTAGGSGFSVQERVSMFPQYTSSTNGGGGGGAGGDGTSATNTGTSLGQAGTGGPGISSSITGTSLIYGAGGGGGSQNGYGSAGKSGLQTNTQGMTGNGGDSDYYGGAGIRWSGQGGGGGSGGSWDHGGAGGSGVLVLRITRSNLTTELYPNSFGYTTMGAGGGQGGTAFGNYQDKSYSAAALGPPGGCGGAACLITSRTVQGAGSINCDGESVPQGKRWAYWQGWEFPSHGYSMSFPGAGGGGAGGTIRILCGIYNYTGSLSAKGGNGGDAPPYKAAQWGASSGGGAPGAGGGGGVVYLASNFKTSSSTLISSSMVSGGNNGSNSANTNYYSTETSPDLAEVGLYLSESITYTISSVNMSDILWY